ncbi:hypothetical protein Tco_1219682 [Tanacetum coccineum]
MSSINSQQTKLDLELVPKEKRLETGKCNGRLNPGKKQRELTYQVFLDALALTPCYSAFLITADVPEVQNGQEEEIQPQFGNFDELPTDEDIVSFFKELGHTGEIKTITDIVVDHMHQPWRNFATIINQSLSGKTTGLDKLHLSRAQILWGMYYKNNVDYVKLLWEDFTYQIDNKGHKKQNKMLLGLKAFLMLFGVTAARIDVNTAQSKLVLLENFNEIILSYKVNAAKGVNAASEEVSTAKLVSTAYFKKPASPKLSTVPTLPKEPTRKSKRVKRPAKKSSDTPIAGVVIIETPVKSLSKKNEKMTVEKRKGIDLLFEVALTEEAQYEEVRKKSLRDFHKTHPSGSGTVTKTAPSTAKIKPSVTNEGTGVKPGVLDVTKEESTEREAKSWGKDEDDSNNDHNSRSKGSDQERDSDDDKAQSDSEKGSNSKHETDEKESGSESNQEKNEEEDETNEEEKNDEFVKTLSNDTDDEDETMIKDKAEGDKDEGMDYTTIQFDDDVDFRMNEPVTTNEGFIQKEGTDAEMTNVQPGNENLEIALNQVIGCSCDTFYCSTED